MGDLQLPKLIRNSWILILLVCQKIVLLLPKQFNSSSVEHDYMSFIVSFQSPQTDTFLSLSGQGKNEWIRMKEKGSLLCACMACY